MNKYEKSIIMVSTSELKGKEAQEDAYNPFEWYTEMRKETPVYFNEEADMWNVFLYEDVKRVLEDTEHFSSIMPEKRKSPFPTSLINMDRPKHTQIRSIVNRSFTPKVMKEWEPRIHEITTDLLNRVEEQKRWDIVQDFSYPLPVIIIAEMLGVPISQMDKFKQWSDVLVSAPQSNSKEHLEQFLTSRTQAEEEISEFFQELIISKRKQSNKLGKDIISILLREETEGGRISGEELIPFCKLLLVAGNETTTNLISNAVYSFIENPESYKQIRDDLSLVPQAVEEVLRYRSPAQRITRRVKQDIKIGDHLLKKDQVVAGWIGSANRDMHKFENADLFDIHRSPNQHLAFGRGAHFCLGAPLARLEANIALTELIKRYNQFTFVQNEMPVPIKESTAIYGLKKLPVVSLTHFNR